VLVSAATPTGFAQELGLVLPPLLTCTYLGTETHKKGKSKSKKKKAESLNSSNASIASVLSKAASMTDKPDWFGFFAPDKERADLKGGRYSKEQLSKQFGNVLCLPCIVARADPPNCFKWCPVPNTPGHGANGESHDLSKLKIARQQWLAIKQEGREKDFVWTI
jgi:hypothetical protein